MNLTILIGEKRTPQYEFSLYSTVYNRWREENRQDLFQILHYYTTTFVVSANAYPKLGTRTSFEIYKKIANHIPFAYLSEGADKTSVYYHSGGRYFRKCIRKKLSNEYKELSVPKKVANLAICLLSSSFYYWFWIAFSDCYHVTKGDIGALSVPKSLLEEPQLTRLADKLIDDLEKNAKVRIRRRADSSQQEEVNYYVWKSKPIIDEIDRVLAKHYGFSDEELDFIINYDIKYRMGRDNGEEESEE